MLHSSQQPRFHIPCALKRLKRKKITCTLHGRAWLHAISKPGRVRGRYLRGRVDARTTYAITGQRGGAWFKAARVSVAPLHSLGASLPGVVPYRPYPPLRSSQPVRMAAIRTLRKLCQHSQQQVCKLHTSASRLVRPPS